ncbi:MAG: hypothetical protein ACYC3V_15285 [Chloroflexota bacterium]
METRIEREEPAALGFLSDDLRQDLQPTQLEAARLSLFELSNSCWYRHETPSF